MQNFIVIVPGSAFGMPGFYRMSLCLGPEAVKKAADQFEISYKKTLEELGYGKKKEEEKCEKKD